MQKNSQQSIPKAFHKKMELDKDIEEIEKEKIIPFIQWRRLHFLQETARLQCIQILKQNNGNRSA